MARSGFRIQRILKAYPRNNPRDAHRTQGQTEEREGQASDRDGMALIAFCRKRQICQRAVNHVVERLTRTDNVAVLVSEEAREFQN